MFYTGAMSTRQPVLFLSHGAPMLADDPTWTSQLHRWASGLERPTNILMVSAHWESRPVTVSSTTPHTPLVYDFYGFPEKYYRVTYDAPVAPELAQRVASVVDGPVRQHPQRGLDHGAYVPLVELFPDADVPVLQVSLPTLDADELVELGRRLTPLRDEGTLIIGSGFTTHNLRWFNPRQDADATPPAASAEFDQWAADAVASGDLDTLTRMEELAPAAREAHPRTEHWAPLYVALGASEATGLASEVAVDGFWYGLSKRSWQFA